MKEVSWPVFLLFFEQEVHQQLEKLRTADGTEALVMFENGDLWSSQMGARTAVAVGPGCTYKSVDEVAKGRLGDVPSRFQYPQAFTREQPVATKGPASPGPVCPQCQRFTTTRELAAYGRCEACETKGPGPERTSGSVVIGGDRSTSRPQRVKKQDMAED